MSKSNLLQGFNNHFFEFLQAVNDYFEDNKDVKKTIVALQGIKKMNPKLIIKYWKSSIADVYLKEIESSQIEFFINKEYGKDVKELGDTNTVLEKIDKLRDPIRNMDEVDQNKCMKYIQNLTKLCILYFKE
tara:strand:+ start:1019 stop:1411 length:393 start_codon:yes stop_codon:yes gene_type:complete